MNGVTVEANRPWFKTEILKRFKGTYVPCQDSFIGMEIVQKPEHGTIELLQIWIVITQQYAKFEKYLSEFDIKPQNIPVRTENKELVKASFVPAIASFKCQPASSVTNKTWQ